MKAYSNAVAEAFFATLECELIDRHIWVNREEARRAIFDYIEGFYNPRRRHSALSTPNASSPSSTFCSTVSQGNSAKD